MAGIGEIDGEPCVAMSYDYTVLAGTQGMRNHLKKDRLFEVAERRRLPVVLFAEGGGGRPGDVDWPIVAVHQIHKLRRPPVSFPKNHPRQRHRRMAVRVTRQTLDLFDWLLGKNPHRQR